MGLLDEMTTYLDLEMPERERLLEVFMRDGGGKGVAMAGQRALNSSGGGSAYKSSESIGHEHFVFDDGTTNMGFTNIGVFSEPPNALYDYELTDKYGAKQYDANLLKQVHERWNDKNDEIDQIGEDMELFEEGMPTSYKDYSLLLNNCKDFVKWHNGEYDNMLRGKGQ